MKIGLLSDIHAEFYRNIPSWRPPLPSGPDVLVLAGDIHVGISLVGFIERVSEALPKTDIIFIAGNHEFYRQNRKSLIDAFRSAFFDNPKVHFLENDYVDIEGVRFIGATLWTNFPLHVPSYTPEEVMQYAKDCVSDFDLIFETAEPASFTPEHAQQLFHESKLKIAEILDQSDPEKTVVITHFPPAMELRHPKFPADKISSYFTADCSDLIFKYQPAYWFYGHNHWSQRLSMGKTQLISNQFGYPDERYKIGGSFNPELMIDL